MPEGVLDDVWLDWGKRLCKFSEAEFGIAVKVKTSHNGYEFGLQRLVAYSLQKASYRNLVNNLVVLVVNSFEGSPNRESGVLLQVLLELLQSELEVNFFGKQNR